VRRDKTWETFDSGVADKQLTVVEPEFAGVLSVMERTGPRSRQSGDRIAAALGFW
jgi:hypothetical protein